MFIALGILIFGIILGRILRSHLRQRVLASLTMASIFLLLFLLGSSIGSNSQLLARLPDLGVQALVITLFCLAGSILLSKLLTPFITGTSKKDNKFKDS